MNALKYSIRHYHVDTAMLLLDWGISMANGSVVLLSEAAQRATQTGNTQLFQALVAHGVLFLFPCRRCGSENAINCVCADAYARNDHAQTKTQTQAQSQTQSLTQTQTQMQQDNNIYGRLMSSSHIDVSNPLLTSALEKGKLQFEQRIARLWAKLQTVTHLPGDILPIVLSYTMLYVPETR